jgi:hypothetical protein
MKTSKRIFALLMTLAMLLSLTTAPAFAAAGDLTKFTYTPTGGDPADYAIPAGGLGLADAAKANNLSTISDAVTIQIPVLAADLAAIDGSSVDVEDVIVPDDDNALTYLKNPNESSTAISAINGAVGSISTIGVGDVLWVLDTASEDNNVARILFVTPESGEIGGTATKKSPVYNVKVPTTLVFAIDPLQIGNISIGTDQISSGTFAFGNGSNVPVKVTVDLTASGNAAANLQPSTWTPTEAYGGVTNNLKLALIGAVSTGGTPTLADPANGAQNYEQAAADTLRWFDPSDKKSTVEFLLEKGDGTSLSANPKANVGIFRVYAELETYAAWASGDIALKGEYTLSGVKNNDYAAPFDAIPDAGANKADDPATKADESTIADADSDADAPAWNGGFRGTADRSDAIETVGLNVLPGEEEVTYGFLKGPGVSDIDNTAKTATYTFTHGTMVEGAIIPFAFDSKTATKIEYPVGTTLSGSWVSQTSDAFVLNSTSFNTLAANTYEMRIIVGGDNWDITFVVQ